MNNSHTSSTSYSLRHRKSLYELESGLDSNLLHNKIHELEQQILNYKNLYEKIKLREKKLLNIIKTNNYSDEFIHSIELNHDEDYQIENNIQPQSFFHHNDTNSLTSPTISHTSFSSNSSSNSLSLSSILLLFSSIYLKICSYLNINTSTSSSSLNHNNNHHYSNINHSKGLKHSSSSNNLLSTSNTSIITKFYTIFYSFFFDRFFMLLCLLFLQSLSSTILKSYDNILNNTPSIVYFLTMLIGSGGNAGNMSIINSLKKLIILTEKEYDKNKDKERELYNNDKYNNNHHNIKRNNSNFFIKYIKYCINELIYGFFIALFLSLFSFLRVYFTLSSSLSNELNNNNTNLLFNIFHINSSIMHQSFTISISLFFIVFLSVILGVSLPYLFYIIGLEPGHAGACLQVLMDILGVFITCFIAKLML